MDDGVHLDQDSLSRSMKTVARGGILVFAGLFVSHIFTFSRRLIIVRYLSESDYGLFSLGMAIFMFAYAICALGLDDGAQRYIAYYRGKKDEARTKGAVYSSGVIASVSVVVITLVLIASARPIASLVDKPDLSWVLLMFAFLLPATRFINLVSAYFQGFEMTSAKAVFSDIGVSVLTLMAVIVAASLNGGLFGILSAFLAGYFLVVMGLACYLVKRFPLTGSKSPRRSITSQMLRFSVPLAFAAIAGELMTYIDSIMLGYFEPARQVGIYNAAVPIYRILPIFLMSAGFIFAPVAARFIAEHKNRELEHLYVSVMFLALLYPAGMISLFFGSRYSGAAVPLQILAAGELIQIIVGPNTRAMIAYGKTKLLMVDTFVIAGVNVALNLLLIPRYGINGAAIATSSAMIAMNVTVLVQLYRSFGIHPFVPAFFKPLILSFASLGIFYYPLRLLVDWSKWMILPCYAIAMAAVLSVTLLSGSVDEDDRAIFDAIKRRFLSMKPSRKS